VGWQHLIVSGGHPAGRAHRLLGSQPAPHPSLKPQAFLRAVVRGVLPLGEGVILDPFASSGSTLAAAEAIGYESIGIEQDAHYFDLARKAIPKGTAIRLDDSLRAARRIKTGATLMTKNLPSPRTR
jgi:DNA modification methylase